MRALVDHVQAVVAPVLLDREVARVAVAAEHLDGEAVGLQAPLAREALGDRGEHLQQQPRLGGRRLVAGVGLVDLARAVQLQRERALGVALLREQHALDVGVLDDRHLRPRRVLAAGRGGAALGPLAGVVERGLVAGDAEHGGAEADADARLVHHVEHAGEALARPADEVADGARRAAHRELPLAQVEQRVGGAAVAELVVEAGQRHVVPLAGEAAVGADQPLRHDEQRDAARAGRQPAVGAGDLRQHQVDDVLGQLVLAGGDPHLVAAQAVARAERIVLASPRRRGWRASPRPTGSTRPAARTAPWCRTSGRRTR